MALAPIPLALDATGLALKLAWRLAALLVAVRVVRVPRVAKPISGVLSKALRWASLAADVWHQKATTEYNTAERVRSAARATKAAAAAAVPSPPPPPPPATPPSSPPATTTTAAASTGAQQSEAEVRQSVNALKVRQIKAELDSLGVRHADAVEKVDLVERLVKARRNPPASAPPPSAAPAPPPPASPPSPPPEVFTAEQMKGAFDGSDPAAAAAAFDGMANNMGVDPADAMAQANKIFSDPEGAKLMMEMQNNPKVMQAAMDIAMNGEAAAQKYANDPEVMELLTKLERFEQMM